MNTKIVIATDSFKGSLSSAEAGAAIADGVRQALPDSDIVTMPVADGGEGTTEAMCQAMSGSMQHVSVHGPLGDKVNAAYCIAGGTAVMEMSQASGLVIVSPNERNPMRTSTYGTGEMILDALHKGCRDFLIGIGGSATNDGGTGMMEALGYKFIDLDGHRLDGCGACLGSIAAIDATDAVHELGECRFTIACDVDTPFCGPEGASRVFAPQKGASQQMVNALELGMTSFARVIERYNGMYLNDMPGTGAAGGLGGAFKAFLGASLRPGIEMVLDALDFSRIITGCQLVITGEGKMDSQTLKGKTPSGVLKYATAQHIPVIAFCGRLEDKAVLSEAGFAGLYEVDAHGLPLEMAMLPETAAMNLRDTAYRTFSSNGPGFLPANAHHIKESRLG